MNIITNNKALNQPSIFTPENLLREARRQKNIEDCKVPEICILDPDGDLVEYLINKNQASINKCWACYHTRLYTIKHDGIEFGILGNAVGASFAVLVAEQLFASGCKHIISITSAGIINPSKNNSKYILIKEALRDEGTSYHYLPAGEKSEIDLNLFNDLMRYFSSVSFSIEPGLAAKAYIISDLKMERDGSFISLLEEKI